MNYQRNQQNLWNNGGMRYYNDEMKCFDGGALGRICCCSTDFCNSVRSRWNFDYLLIIILLFIITIITQ